MLTLIEKYLAKSNSGLLGVLCGPLSISFDTKYVEQIRDFLGRCQEDKKGERGGGTTWYGWDFLVAAFYYFEYYQTFLFTLFLLAMVGISPYMTVT